MIGEMVIEMRKIHTERDRYGEIVSYYWVDDWLSIASRLTIERAEYLIGTYRELNEDAVFHQGRSSTKEFRIVSNGI